MERRRGTVALPNQAGTRCGASFGNDRSSHAIGISRRGGSIEDEKLPPCRRHLQQYHRLWRRSGPGRIALAAWPTRRPGRAAFLVASERSGDGSGSGKRQDAPLRSTATSRLRKARTSPRTPKPVVAAQAESGISRFKLTFTRRTVGLLAGRLWMLSWLSSRLLWCARARVRLVDGDFCG